MKLDLAIKFECIKIYFNGVLHLHIQRPIFAIQSWVQEPQGKWIIQYTTAGGEVTSEYDSREKWESILSALDKVL